MRCRAGIYCRDSRRRPGVVGPDGDRPASRESPAAVKSGVRAVARAIAMAKRLYVGNLSYSATSDDLQELFEPFGTVVSAEVLADRETGRSRGFGFVEMESDADAEAAIAALDGKEHLGRRLNVNESRP